MAEPLSDSLAGPIKGLVVRNTGSDIRVHADDGCLLDCKVKGNLRIKGIRSTNPVAIGDRVVVTGRDGNWFIQSIEDRRNYIVRKPANLSKQLHIIAANIDVALIVVTVNHPETNLVFLDRYLATAEAYNVPVYLVFNKVDLYDEDDLEYLSGLENLYRTIGYECFRVSAVQGVGVSELLERLHGKTCLLSGNSGVGKSSLLNAFAPEINAKVGQISDAHDTGMHTTSYSEMFTICGDIHIIDTPGIKGFNTIDMKPEEVGHYFPEIFKASSECRYGNCTHRHEPGCAVLKAIEDHLISESRYNSYLSIIDDYTEGKYRLGQGTGT